MLTSLLTLAVQLELSRLVRRVCGGGDQQGLRQLIGQNLELDKWYGVDVECGYDFCSPLDLCAAGGHIKCVQLLIDAQADVNLHSAYFSGSCALATALNNGHRHVAELLQQNGATT